jgi:hypothetical protein
MCLQVWVGARSALPERPMGSVPDLGHHVVSAAPRDAPVRAHFAAPHVSYVGAYDHCGCGFNADPFVVAEIELVSDLVELRAALDDEERADFELGQRCRDALAQLVETARATGEVEVYACMAGDEADAPARRLVVDASHFQTRVAPLAAGTLYVVARAGAG